jgi:ribosomal protein L7Ae-like RNA K-turn-binding protein
VTTTTTTTATEPPHEPRSGLLIRIAGRGGGLARGALETVRAVEKGTCRVAFLASDINRAGLADLLRALCRRNDVPLIERHGKSELGAWAGIERPCAAVAVTRIGDPETFVAALLEGAPALARSLNGLQQLFVRSPGAADPREAIRAAEAAVAAAAAEAEAASDAPQGHPAEQAVARMLQATLALAAHHGVDLQRIVDRWTLRDWLESD